MEPKQTKNATEDKNKHTSKMIPISIQRTTKSRQSFKAFLHQSNANDHERFVYHLRTIDWQPVLLCLRRLHQQLRQRTDRICTSITRNMLSDGVPAEPHLKD